MTTIRQSHHEAGFTVVGNSAIDIKGLSLRAKGLLLHILRKPDSWILSPRHVATEVKEGESAIRSALSELMDAGLVVRIQGKDELGKFAHGDYIFYDASPDCRNPDTENRDAETRMRKTAMRKTGCGKPRHGNQPQINKYKINKYIQHSKSKDFKKNAVEAVAEGKNVDAAAAAAASENLFKSQEEELAFRVWFKKELVQRGKPQSSLVAIANAVANRLNGKSEPCPGDLEDLESFREESQKKSQRAAYFEQQEREFEKILEISKAEGFTAGYKYAMSKRLYAKVREWGPFKEWLEDPNRPKKSA